MRVENAVLKHLASKFGLVRLDPAKVQQMLNRKLPRHEIRVTAPVSIRPGVAKPLTTIEAFEEELLAGLLARPNTSEQRRGFLLDLSARASYRKLAYSEIEAALLRVSGKLLRTEVQNRKC
jgi:hypothetical protein